MSILHRFICLVVKPIKFLNFHVRAVLLTLVVFANIILADSSIDLSEYLEPPNLKKEYAYSLESLGPSGNIKDKYLGRVIEIPVGSVDVNGNEYQARLYQAEDYQIFTLRDIKFFNGWSDEGIVEAYDFGTGDLKDFVKIPSGIKEGTSSETTAHFWETVKTVELVNYESPVGQFDNCIKIREFTAELETEGGDEDIHIYCPKNGQSQSQQAPRFSQNWSKRSHYGDTSVGE